MSILQDIIVFCFLNQVSFIPRSVCSFKTETNHCLFCCFEISGDRKRPWQQPGSKNFRLKTSGWWNVPKAENLRGVAVFIWKLMLNFKKPDSIPLRKGIKHKFKWLFFLKNLSITCFYTKEIFWKVYRLTLNLYPGIINIQHFGARVQWWLL